MKQSVRFFSIGLFVATIFLGGFYLFADNSSAKLDSVPVELLISQIEKDGYHVITEDEFISFSMQSEGSPGNKVENANEEVKDEKKEKPAEDNEEKKDEKKDKADDSKEKEEKKEDKKDSKKDTDKESKKEDKKEEDEKDKVKKITLTNSAGVVSQDIADTLVENGIIEDRQKFLDYLDKNDYSGYIQLGKFELTSDMDYYEIAEKITTYPGKN